MTPRGYLLTAAHCSRGQNRRRDALQCSTAPKTAGPPSRVTTKTQRARSLRFLDMSTKEGHSQGKLLTGGRDQTGKNPREGFSCSTYAA